MTLCEYYLLLQIKIINKNVKIQFYFEFLATCNIYFGLPELLKTLVALIFYLSPTDSIANKQVVAEADSNGWGDMMLPRRRKCLQIKR